MTHICSEDCIEKYTELLKDGDKKALDKFASDHIATIMICETYASFDTPEEFEAYMSYK